MGAATDASRTGREGRRLGQGAVFWLALTLVGLTTYGPAAWLEYGRADDYWFVLHNAVNAPEDNARNLVEGGRFVAAVISEWVFPHVDTVPELWQMRLAAIGALALTGAVLSVMTLRLMGGTRSSRSLTLALLVGVVPIVTPAAPSSATWGVMALELWAMPLALAGGLVATAEKRVLGLRWEVTSGVLVFLAAFTYQPAASACLLPTFLWSALRWARREPPQWRRPIWVTLLLGMSLASDVAIVKMLDLAGNDRIGAHGLRQSLFWLIEFSARTVAASVPTTLVSAGFTLIVLTVAMLSPRLLGRRFLALPASVLAAWFLATLILLPGDQFASYRQVMTAQTILWAGSLVCVALTIRERTTPDRGGVSWFLPVTIVSAVALAGLSGYRAYFYLAKPNVVDWASVRCVLARAKPLTRDSVLVLAPHSESTSPVRSSDEYGMIATNLSWALPDVVWLAAESLGHGGPPPRVKPGQLRVVRSSSVGNSSQRALRFKHTSCSSAGRHGLRGPAHGGSKG